MELKHLKYFIAVAEELHFGRAARRLNMSQPPLSNHIRKLEEELNTPLFIRTSRNVQLTDAGRMLLQDSQELFTRFDEMIERIVQLDMVASKRLNIGFIGPAINSFLSDAIRNFNEKHSDIILSMYQMSSYDQIKALRNDSIHIGFIRVYEFENFDIKCETIWTEQYVLALHVNHYLSSRKTLSLKDLVGEKIILYPRKMQPVLYDKIMESFKSSGVKPKIYYEVSTKNVALELVVSNLGITIVPHSTSKVSPPGVVYRPIIEKLPAVEIAMICKNPYIFRLIDEFISCVRATVLEKSV
jgi:DNA-binding transcriptional LysR family regulator